MLVIAQLPGGLYPGQVAVPYPADKYWLDRPWGNDRFTPAGTRNRVFANELPHRHLKYTAK